MANKIIAALSMREFRSLLNLVKEKEITIKSLNYDSDFNNPLIQSLLDSLSEDQKEEFIEQEVKKVLSRATGIPADEIEKDHKLEEDLHMNSLLIRALAVPFTNIARQFNPDAVISPDECEECETVKDCIEIVLEKSKN